MINFVFGIYRFLFSLLVFIGLLLFVVFALAFIAGSSGDSAYGYSMPVMIALMAGGFCFMMVLLGDFATKIKIADELTELKEIISGKGTVSTKELEQEVKRLSKQLTPPIKVMAVKPKVQDDNPPA